MDKSLKKMVKSKEVHVSVLWSVKGGGWAAEMWDSPHINNHRGTLIRTALKTGTSKATKLLAVFDWSECSLISQCPKTSFKVLLERIK